MADAYSGLDLKSFRVVADFEVDGVAAGEDLSARFRQKTPGVWELRLGRPIAELKRGKLTVSVSDRQGNATRVERSFSVGSEKR
jgi:hypothetical protein